MSDQLDHMAAALNMVDDSLHKPPPVVTANDAEAAAVYAHSLAAAQHWREELVDGMAQALEQHILAYTQGSNGPISVSIEDGWKPLARHLAGNLYYYLHERGLA